MPVEAIRTGGCLCGAVRYEVWGEPYQSGLCHCKTCRKITGSAFSATANWHRRQFQMSGEISTFDKRSFCPVCGSRLFFLFDGGVEVFLGTLDEAPYAISPMVEVWNIRREPWLGPVVGAALHEGNEIASE
ncbi:MULTISPECIES: GFA family protein [Rhizobium]|uniref:GFA family protein n=1 Tax=Rhizobium TaxID=379 RepID=UPI000522F37F|nr:MULTISPECIES: GFA family protein [Rhizobium]KPN24421.1 aldehyde-activating protein [Rhizobium brockwellii]MDV4154138.1 GFA family protein [Rhizobium brockwellii]NZD48478.1 GFA family protein [Rhizobium leguminosarum]QJX04238.1 GFA family protein [Rhizobium brockwellii]TAX38300.1 GFA family protein [Rhizobium leguminosarum]